MSELPSIARTASRPALRRPKRGGRIGAAMLLAMTSISVAVVMHASAAMAREVTLTTTMDMNFRGIGGYLIIYVLDKDGGYVSTLHAAGRSTRYYNQFRSWWRATGTARVDRQKEFDAVTGPSLTRGEVLTLTVDLPDALFDAGYVIKIDSTVQDGRDFPSDVIAPLATEADGQKVLGGGYVLDFVIDL